VVAKVDLAPFITLLPKEPLKYPSKVAAALTEPPLETVSQPLPDTPIAMLPVFVQLEPAPSTLTVPTDPE